MAKKTTKKAVKRTPKGAKPKGGDKPIAATSGRPQGTGRYGCPTKVVRVPVHLEGAVTEFCLKQVKKK